MGACGVPRNSNNSYVYEAEEDHITAALQQQEYLAAISGDIKQHFAEQGIDVDVEGGERMVEIDRTAEELYEQRERTAEVEGEEGDMIVMMEKVDRQKRADWERAEWERAEQARELRDKEQAAEQAA